MTSTASSLTQTASFLAALLGAALLPALAAEAPPDYATQGFFVSRPMAVEGEGLVFRARVTGGGAEPSGRLVIKDAAGGTVADEALAFAPGDGRRAFSWEWKPAQNGLYTATATLEGGGWVFENTATRQLELTVPVVVKDRQPHFPWFNGRNQLRWMTVSTSTPPEMVAAYRERGIKALGWTFGGMNLVNQDWMKNADMNEVRRWFVDEYGRKLADPAYDGIGIDEFGGYPGTRAEESSHVALGVLRELREKPAERKAFVAAWQGGMLRPDRAELFRGACDLLLQQTYLFGAMREWLLTENIYAMVDDKIMAGARGTDILVPGYGEGGCLTILCLDIAGIPPQMHTGEIEQAVRYMRRIAPEMRGIGFYNGVDFPEGSTPEMVDRLERFGDAMCLKYFLKPVVTLMPGSLWVERDAAGKVLLCAGVSNIGAMDSGPVDVVFYDNGKEAGRAAAEKVPAGGSTSANRVVLKTAASLAPGFHALEAVVENAAGSTVLDGRAATEWFESR